MSLREIDRDTTFLGQGLLARIKYGVDYKLCSLKALRQVQRARRRLSQITESSLTKKRK